jgi:tetratricopeptide (TPR) repeat protein
MLPKMPNLTIIFKIFFIIYAILHGVQYNEDINDVNKYIEFGEYDKCLIKIKEILKDNNSSIEANRLYQNIMIELDQYPLLIKEYEQKVRRSPNNYAYNYLYGRILSLEENLFDKAKEYFVKAIELNKKDPWAYLGLAIISMKSNEFNISIELINKCIRECGDFIPGYLLIIECQQKIYGNAKAIETIVDLVTRFPNDYDLNMKLVDLFINKNEINRARQIIDKLLHIYKNDYRYHRIIYVSAICAASISEKERLLKYYWGKYPNSINIIAVYTELFNMYKIFNIYEAINISKEALKLKTNILKIKTKAYEYLIEYYKYNNKKELINLCEEMLEGQFSNPNILIELGKVYLEESNYELAIKLLKKAEKSCDWQKIEDNILMGHLNNEEREKIIQLYLSISYKYLGQAYYNEGEYLKAVDYYKRIGKIDSNFKDEMDIGIAKCYMGLKENVKAKEILLESYIQSKSPRVLKTLMDSFRNEKEDIDRILDIMDKSNIYNNANESIQRNTYLSKYKGKIIVFTLHSLHYS